MADAREANKLSKREMAHVRAYIAKMRASKTQTVVAEELGVSQPLISRIEAEDAPHTITIGMARLMAASIGVSYEVFTRGTEAAGRWEAEDAIPMRGRALDVLSAVYEEEFLDAVHGLPEPDGSADWTLEEWTDWVQEARKSWRRGLLRLPNLPPPK